MSNVDRCPHRSTTHRNVACAAAPYVPPRSRHSRGYRGASRGAPVSCRRAALRGYPTSKAVHVTYTLVSPPGSPGVDVAITVGKASTARWRPVLSIQSKEDTWARRGSGE